MLRANPLGEPDRGERLEQREQRPAEQPRLLAGDDGDRLRRAVARRRRSLRPARRGGVAAPARGPAIVRPLTRMPLRARDRRFPRWRIGRVAGKEFRHAR